MGGSVSACSLAAHPMSGVVFLSSRRRPHLKDPLTWQMEKLSGDELGGNMTVSFKPLIVLIVSSALLKDAV